MSSVFLCQIHVFMCFDVYRVTQNIIQNREGEKRAVTLLSLLKIFFYNIDKDYIKYLFYSNYFT